MRHIFTLPSGSFLPINRDPPLTAGDEVELYSGVYAVRVTYAATDPVYGDTLEGIVDLSPQPT